MWERLGPAAAGTALLEFFLTDDGTSVFVSFPGATEDTVLQLPEVRYGEVTAAVEDGLDDVRATLSAEERDRDPGGMMRALRWLFRSIFRTPDARGISSFRP
jgi:hypothetical protein